MFNYGSPYSGMPIKETLLTFMTLGQQARARFNALPKEEQERILKERATEKEQKRVAWFLSQGKCPYCGSKLERGKKDKKNDYKRVWTCKTCDKTFTSV